MTFGDLKIGQPFTYKGQTFVKFASNSATRQFSSGKYVIPFAAETEVAK